MTWDYDRGGLDLATLRRAYCEGALTVERLIEAVLARCERPSQQAVWLHRLGADALLTTARSQDTRMRTNPQWWHRWPLLGIPFAVKDNIDVAGQPTTAGCSAFGYVARETAHAVERLLAAGAILVGKTNLDQFATGLVGTRSPYGVPRNPFNPVFIPGGSSSGSAVAVATGTVSFALGTDTAGSGRVPAGLNNIVGLKPTRGLVSTRGVVPACRSLDCVSVFALTVADAVAVTAAMSGYDPLDPFSRPEADICVPRIDVAADGFRGGLVSPEQLAFFGDAAAQAIYQSAVARAIAFGATFGALDFSAFREAAALLYEGPWVAERYLAVRPVIERDPKALHSDLRLVFEHADRYRATDAFASFHRLEAIKRKVREALAALDGLLVPTVPRAYRLDEVYADPLGTNANLGYYTNSVNLLDLCAVSVPAGIGENGVPYGVTLIGNPFTESRLAGFAAALQRVADLPLGATGLHAPGETPDLPKIRAGYVRLCVSGAHMSGLPLNHQLALHRGRLVMRTRTAPRYRLYLLDHLDPPRPGLLRVTDGSSIEVEVWELPEGRFGTFVAAIPPPLGIGTVELDGGEAVKGFLCEADAVRSARDITHLGGWRAYLENAGRR